MDKNSGTLGLIFKTLHHYLDQTRLRLASPDAIMLLSLLAVLTGLLTGLIIVAFRFLLEYLQTGLLPSGKIEDFESLSELSRFLFPVVGGVVLGVLFQSVPKPYRAVGILHVMERLQYHQGRLPGMNMVMQFVGAGVAILSGHSVGREGPGVHMGAYAGSWWSQRLHLPNNSRRTLVACGTAAAIGASFNTPLAGIIFAMEVIVQQYTVQSFVPVILAAVSGTYLSLSLIGEEIFFTVELQAIGTSFEWPLVILLGIGIGILSAAFNFILIQVTKFTTNWAVFVRFSVAGLLMGVLAWWVPQTMGIGYDTLHETLNAQLGLEIFAMILLAKVLATVVCIGFGIPAGVIGPLMFIGALAGAVLVTTLFFLNPAWIPDEPKLYPLLGMGAMFAASLQAPLAGLTAVIELSNNENIILPAMLAVVSASLTSKVIFRHDSLFRELLQARGQDHSTTPVMQRLRMIGAASVMNRSFALCEDQLARDTAVTLLSKGHQWLLITGVEREPTVMIRALDVQSYLETHPDDDTLTLTDIPGQRLQLAPLSIRASLQEALDSINAHSAEALYLHREAGGNIYGVITRARIEKAYQ